MQRQRKAESGVQRRAIEDGDICPICYDDFSGVDTAQLVFCGSGCGQNVHGKCMRVCVQHAATTQQVRSPSRHDSEATRRRQLSGECDL